MKACVHCGSVRAHEPHGLGPQLDFSVSFCVNVLCVLWVLLLLGHCPVLALLQLYLLTVLGGLQHMRKPVTAACFCLHWMPSLLLSSSR